MKAIVIIPFWDKNNLRLHYEKDQTVDLDEERVKELVKLGCVKIEQTKKKGGEE